jgi:hypothetical protein
MGPGRVNAAAGSGSDYPGLGHSDPDYYANVHNGLGEWPTWNPDPMQQGSVLVGYGPLNDQQHWPRLWYVPAVLDGDPIWTEIGMATANGALVSTPGGSMPLARSWKSSATGRQYSGIAAALDDRPRAMAWGTLAVTRVDAFLPDNHPSLPVWSDMADDVPAAYIDYYITSGLQDVNWPGLHTQGAVAAGWGQDVPPYINAQYMNSFLAGVMSQEAWKEQDNGRRSEWFTFLNGYYRKSLIDLWDNDIDPVRSEYYMAIGTGYGNAYFSSDDAENFYTTPGEIYSVPGWSEAYPSGAPSTGVANNDPAIPAGASGTMYGNFLGRGGYPYDSNNYYTISMYHLNWMTRANVPGADKLAARIKARINGATGTYTTYTSVPGPLWSAPASLAPSYYYPGNTAMFVVFNITPA